MEAAVASVVGTPGISRSALERVVAKLCRRARGAESARTITRRAHDARFQHVEARLELPSVRGDAFVWRLCHPARMLELLLAESEQLQLWFSEAWEQHPCTERTPWTLLIGWDEFVPGNKLASRPSRTTKDTCVASSPLWPCTISKETLWPLGGPCPPAATSS